MVEVRGGGGGGGGGREREEFMRALYTKVMCNVLEGCNILCVCVCV